jgi:hypothetical protein
MIGGVMNGHCQTKMTEGRIVYKLTSFSFQDTINPDTSIVKEMIFRFNAHKQRIDYISFKNDTTVTIYDNATGEAINLDNYNGQKEARVEKFPPLDILMKPDRKTIYTIFADTAIIDGYKCYSAYRQVKGDGAIYFVDYTMDINAPLPYSEYYFLNCIDGFPMNYSFVIFGKRIQTRIKSISFEKIDERIFEIPKDYKIINPYSSTK